MSKPTRFPRVTSSYRGSGELYLADGGKVRCTAKIDQFSSGRIIAICRVRREDINKVNFFEEVNQLKGTTTDGKTFLLTHAMIVGNRFSLTSRASRILMVTGQELTVSKKRTARTNLTVTFAITNMTLEDELSIKCGGFSLRLVRANDYEALVDYLKGSHGVDVTCEATVKLGALTRRDRSIRVTNDLCLLLTLARGTRVNWISYCVRKKGKGEFHYHRDAITKPFSGLPLIAKQPHRDTIEYLKKTYAALRRERNRWELQKAIEGYSDAKIETDYLESRALKVVVTMEHLKGCFLKRTKRTRIIAQSRFKPKENRLKKQIRGLVGTLFPDTSQEKLEMMANHTPGINWYPFGRAVADVCKEIGLKAANQERRKFKEIRDRLVHAMSFQPNYGKPWEQYRFVVTFVGKVLLAILGYDGYYYDWTREPGWEGTNSPMRVKLDLAPGRGKGALNP